MTDFGMGNRSKSCAFDPQSAIVSHEDHGVASMNRIAKIHAALERHYGSKTPRRASSNPLDDLILTILSQKTGDMNSRGAFRMLRQILPTWEQVHRAPESALAEAIGSAGLANKAACIKAILSQIHHAQGHFDLTFLRDVSVEEATAFLGRLNGIGPKTVARILLVSVNGRRLLFFEPEGEHAAAAVTAGMSMSGLRATNFSSGQGIAYMHESLYAAVGKRLTYVLNVAARAMTKQALNVHAGHDDYHAVDDTGFFQLFAKDVQETADLDLIAHRIAELSLNPGICAQ